MHALTKFRIIGLLILVFFGSFNIAAEDTEMSAEEKAYWEQVEQLWNGLDKQSGEITLPNGIATLSLGDKFIYLNPKDADVVLSDIWGNPPSELSQGMIMPKKYSPMDEESWAVSIDYEEDGYISDEDANSINYEKILKQLKKDTKAANQYREDEGYGSVELIGWASDPHYDQSSKKMHWAKEISFEGVDVNTLNYDIRVLGRKGVLLMSFIASMDQLAEIDYNLEPVLAMTEFTEGNRYTDFNPDMDKVAAYGLGALVAGKLAAKTGLLAALFIALKKFWIILFLGIGAFFKRLFGRNKSEE